MYKTWDMKISAPVVFLDFVEGSDIGSELKKCFITEKEYIYYNKEDSEELLKQGTITDSLVEKRNKGLLTIPGDKFVFAFYVDLFRADKDMVEKIHCLMEDFSDKLHPGNASDVGYLLCYRHDWEKESLLTSQELVASIHRNVSNTVHAEYLLYSSMFVTYHLQEEALVRYLHMLSRDTDAARAALSYERDYLCAFALEKYDVGTAESNDRIIMEYRNWLQKEKDKYCNELCNKIVGHAEGLVRGYYDIQGEFVFWQRLFPRKASDFMRVSLLWHKLNAESAPHIEEERERYKAEYLKQLEQKADWGELKNWLRKNVTYSDFRNLQDEDVKTVFMEDVKEALQKEYQDLRYDQQIEQAVLELYEKKIAENLNDLENWHKEVEEKLHQKQEEVQANGKYRNMADCMDNIKGNIHFTIPVGISQQGRRDWLMFREEFLESNLAGGGKNMGEDIYVYPDLRPCSVQLLSVARYKPEDNLFGQILKKGKGDERQDHK